MPIYSQGLEEVSKMKERNFAVELLRKLIAEQVYQRTNAVRAATFSETLVIRHQFNNKKRALEDSLRKEDRLPSSFKH